MIVKSRLGNALTNGLTDAGTPLTFSERERRGNREQEREIEWERFHGPEAVARIRAKCN